MKITREAYGIKVLENRVGAEPGQPSETPPSPGCCDDDETTIPDRANEGNGGDAWTYVDDSTPAYVQSATSGLVGGASSSTQGVDFDTPATENNLLVSVIFHRAGAGRTHTPDTGWTVVGFHDGFYGRLTVAYKIAAGGETGIDWTYLPVTHEFCVMIAEYEGGVYALDDFDSVDDTAGPDLTLPTVTPSAGLPGIVLAFLMQQPSEEPDFDPPWTRREETFDSGGNRSRYEMHDQVVSSFSGSYGGETGTGISDGTTDASYFLVSFSLPGPVWLGDGAKAIDGDDATYEEVTGPNLLRIDLGAEHRIVRTRLRVALSGSSARELTIRAAKDDDPEFEDADTLSVITFTSTGSFTAQDLDATWATTESYRWFELTSDDTDTWRIHSSELYEGTLAIDLADHTEDTDDAHDASAISYDPTSSGLTATNVQDAIDEAAGLSGGVTDHGALTGLADDDHEQYVLRSILTTRGDLFRRGASAIERVALGADGRVLASDGTDAVWEAQYATVIVVIDGGGAAITTGVKCDLTLDFAGVIEAATLLADQSGSIVIDVWKDTYANYPPTDADSITASAPPTISSAVKSQDTTLTGWTTAVAAGDTLRFNVDSATTVTRVTLALKVRRT